MKTHYDVDQIRALRTAGMSCKQIAAEIGSAEEYTRRLMQRLGIPRLERKARMRFHPRYRNGRILDKGGYVLLLMPGHRLAGKAGRYVREHRLVMEGKLGRKLRKGEIVHHRDGNPANNAPENLELFASNAVHLRHQLQGRIPNWTPQGRKALQAAARRLGLRNAAKRRHSKSDAPPQP